MKPKQLDMVREILTTTKKISRNQCIRDFVTTRLSAYILDLKNEGWDISAARQNGDYVYYLNDKPKKLETVVERDEHGSITRVYEEMR